MRLAFDTLHSSEIRPRDIIDYGAFRRKFRRDKRESELHLAERFYAAKSLFEKGSDRVYTEVPLQADDDLRKPAESLTADLCGVSGDELTLVFCEMAPPTEELLEKLKAVDRSTNARALVLYPSAADRPRMQRISTKYKRLDVACIPWLDQNIDDAFRQVFEMVELLANQTRVRMLTPLLEKGFRKKDYRRVINPKLLYENLANLMESGIIDEAEDESYRLTQLGSDLLGEYLTFLERIRRAIERETYESRGGET
jgi:DNA-binding HxlR family transcriptional regulator